MNNNSPSWGVNWNIEKSPAKTTLITTQRTTQRSSQKGSQKSSQKILSLITENTQITTQEMANLLGISRRAVAKQLANLQTEGIVKRVGPDKGGHWEINERY